MSTARKVKFVASDPARGGLPVKRKQVQQACASCRRKKRRCIHAQDVDDQPLDEHSATAVSSPPTPPVPNSNHESPQSHTHGSVPAYHASVSAPASASPVGDAQLPSSSSKARSSRFVGDLNPEGIFMEAAGSAFVKEGTQKGDVGIWFSSSVPGAGQAQLVTSRPPQIMDRFLLPFVREHCLSCVPPEADFAKFRHVFLHKIHPIFPVIPAAALAGDLGSPSNVLLRQLVCLAAVTDPEMRPYLYLENKGSELLTASDFSQTVSSAVRAILETSIIPDRILHIRALTILSLYTQPTCAEEADLPAQLGGRAIHHIQTLGLHLLPFEGPYTADMENLFCAVWALDRINTAIYARPCLFHERDIGTNLHACIKNQPPCFRLLLFVVQWLDQVFELYRPGPSAEISGMSKVAYIDLPVLEAMIVDADALHVPSPLIATIEAFYHAVIILSCRLPRPGTAPAAATLPPPSANARRSLAAERIACAVQRDSLSPLPFIPYAVSLALSVEYRKMRHSRLPMFRTRAMNAFQRNCDLLRSFGDYFWNAKVVAGLGERVMKEMERAANTMARDSTPLPPDVPRATVSLNEAAPAQSMEQTVSEAPMPNGPRLDSLVDYSLADAISGQDFFGHIDPNFNLNAVEDALEANLDVGLPLNWADFGHFAV
ncbi:hypothetical protein B0I35DRAFT_476561 [Stachybotrys elegans]|uniref:Transcription factor domain-containing protein n=1 Tax=Stachybotrys elegans TaxID=80388 RepID=A0A8K0SVC7_9HYPO|nr:hypothetical protein B0I35DRAFT_476561 [Stachybotrys elegans]